MEQLLFNWLLGLIKMFSEFGNWLVTPFIADLTPLTLFSLTGLTFLISLLVIHLLNPLS